MKETLPKNPWPFDVKGPSTLGAELERSRAISERNSRDGRKNIYKGWSIGKSDPNERFNAINASQFGTRQRRNSK